jgi:hypothetical protein
MDGHELGYVMDDGNRRMVQVYALIDMTLNHYDYFVAEEAEAVEEFRLQVHEISNTTEFDRL